MRTTTAAYAIALAAQLVPAVAAAQQEVILVRHAELQGAAMADPKSLPLSPVGRERAQRLAGMLKDSEVAAIYVTDFARTNQTALPLSKELDRPLTVVPKGDPQELVERLRRATAESCCLSDIPTRCRACQALGHPAT